MNLIAFALFSTKIPSSFLSPQRKKTHHLKNLFSLTLDAVCVLLATFIITGLFKVSSEIYLMRITNKFTVNFPPEMTLITFPLMLFSYFAICLLACDGRTLGTLLTKQRMASENSYRKALLFTLNVLSCHLFYWKVKDLFMSEDHRYQQLMQERLPVVDLMALLEKEDASEEAPLTLAA